MATLDLYSRKDPALKQKLFVTGVEFGLLVLSGWVLFGPGGGMMAQQFDWAAGEAIPLRRVLIFGFSLVILARMVFTMFVLMKREMPWSEAFSVPFAFAVYYLGFALMVLPNRAPLGALDALGIALFVIGCVLNTGGEWQRHRFKADPANKGKLFTGGFFAWSMHINYFGDILWVAGYAVVTGNPWSALIVLMLTGFFAFYNIPMLDAHLADRYGEQFEAYAKQTKKLIPFVW